MEKDINEFYKNRTHKDGLDSYCKGCRKAYQNANKERSMGWRIINKKHLEAYRDSNKKKNNIINKLYYKANKEKINIRQKAYNEVRKEGIAVYQKIYNQKNKERIKIRQNSPVTAEQWLQKIPCIDKPLLENNQITVECKLCNDRFAPTRQQIEVRWKAWDGKTSGECNFYCSDGCKYSCPLYRFSPERHIDPKSKLYIQKTEQQEVRACQTRTLKEMQCDEVGYNYCERCGDIIDVELHHTLPVAEFGKEAINPAGHMLLCVGCHIVVHGEC